MLVVAVDVCPPCAPGDDCREPAPKDDVGPLCAPKCSCVTTRGEYRKLGLFLAVRWVDCDSAQAARPSPASIEETTPWAMQTIFSLYSHLDFPLPLSPRRQRRSRRRNRVRGMRRSTSASTRLIVSFRL